VNPAAISDCSGGAILIRQTLAHVVDLVEDEIVAAEDPWSRRGAGESCKAQNSECARFDDLSSTGRRSHTIVPDDSL